MLTKSKHRIVLPTSTILNRIVLPTFTILNLPQHQFMHTFSWLEKMTCWLFDLPIYHLSLFLVMCKNGTWSSAASYLFTILASYIWKIPWALAGMHCSTPRMPADSCLDTALSLKTVLSPNIAIINTEKHWSQMKLYFMKNNVESTL